MAITTAVTLDFRFLPLRVNFAFSCVMCFVLCMEHHLESVEVFTSVVGYAFSLERPSIMSNPTVISWNATALYEEFSPSIDERYEAFIPLLYVIDEGETCMADSHSCLDLFKGVSGDFLWWLLQKF